MANAERLPLPKQEPTITLALTEREAEMLIALTGMVHYNGPTAPIFDALARVAVDQRRYVVKTADGAPIGALSLIEKE